MSLMTFIYKKKNKTSIPREVQIYQEGTKIDKNENAIEAI